MNRSALAPACAILCGLPATTLPAQPGIRSHLIADGINACTTIAHPPEDADRLFVCEKNSAYIRIVELPSGDIRQQPFLNVRAVGPVNTTTERGLLGLAFHPDYGTNGLFYICYTGAEGEQIIQELSVSAGDPNLADPASARAILTIPREHASHIAGWIGFGPHDGLLYVASGDDTRPVYAQFTQDQLFGKMLRIDINGDDFPADPTRNYAIPPNNPYVGTGDVDEAIAYGLRNPWRNAFDPATGDLFIADVGENRREEISVFPADSPGGLNYGWPCYEGDVTYQPLICDPGDPLTPPVHAYTHAEGCAVIGGAVYRGCAIEGLDGHYFFADFCRGAVWSFRYDRTSGQTADLTDWTAQLTPAAGFDGILTLGTDARGEIYIATRSALYKIIPGGPSACCYADCDPTGPLDVFDFLCFQDAFVNADPYADCNGDQVFDVFDFLCFQDAFAAGCP